MASSGSRDALELGTDFRYAKPDRSLLRCTVCPSEPSLRATATEVAKERQEVEGVTEPSLEHSDSSHYILNDALTRSAWVVRRIYAKPGARPTLEEIGKAAVEAKQGGPGDVEIDEDGEEE